MVLVLWLQGRVWLCAVDSPSLFCFWSGNTWSKHNSQHIFDPYTFTHILHGITFFWILLLIGKKLLSEKLSFAWFLFFVVFAAASWEIVENTRYVIEVYRSNTAALEYYGDSIINSLGDVLAAVVGFLIAYRMRLLWSLLLFFIVEALLLLLIRDSLLFNVIMLIYPIEAIRTWQLGG